ncbi:MAG: hypothetical protein QXO71_12085 [Candidatus Jordarchaeaceae archaeon]
MISAEEPINEIVSMESEQQVLIKPHEIILQTIKENGLYRIKYSFNGRLYEPKSVGKVLSTLEKDLKLIREGVKGEPAQGGISFSILTYDRETMHRLYLFLISQRARVKVEHITLNERQFEKIQESILRETSG